MKVTAERILIGVLLACIIFMGVYLWTLRKKVSDLAEKQLELIDKQLSEIEDGQGAVEKDRAAGAVQTIIIREEKERKDEEAKNIRPTDLDADGGEDYFAKRYPKKRTGS